MSHVSTTDPNKRTKRGIAIDMSDNDQTQINNMVAALATLNNAGRLQKRNVYRMILLAVAQDDNILQAVREYIRKEAVC